MTSTARYLFIVRMDVDPEKEALFNEVYDHDHIPHLLKVPGVLGVRRAKSEDFRIALAGEVKAVAAEPPAYTAIYEIEDPAVLASDAWAAAVEAGRWAGEVRPFTRNRSHQLMRIL